MIRAALIGISGYARTHLLMLMEQVLHGRLQLTAVTVINQEEEAFFCHRLTGLGCQIYASTDEMWAACSGKIDLCLIPTGIHHHAPMTIAALEHGANVLVEKPLAATLVEIDAIQAAEQATGRWVAVGFQDLYAPAAQQIKRRLGAGEFGPLRSITVTGLWPRPRSYYTRNAWAGRLRANDRWVLDSPVNNAFAHFINLALFWASPQSDGSAELKTLETKLWRVQPIESFDTVALRATTTDDVTLLAYLSHAARETTQARLVLETEKVKIVWTHLQHRELLWTDGRREVLPQLGSTEVRLTMMDALVRRLENPREFICTTAIARAHTALIERLHADADIANVPAALLETSGSAHDPQVSIRCLAELFTKAAKHQTLPTTLE